MIFTLCSGAVSIQSAVLNVSLNITKLFCFVLSISILFTPSSFYLHYESLASRFFLSDPFILSYILTITNLDLLQVCIFIAMQVCPQGLFLVVQFSHNFPFATCVHSCTYALFLFCISQMTISEYFKGERPSTFFCKKPCCINLLKTNVQCQYVWCSFVSPF